MIISITIPKYSHARLFSSHHAYKPSDISRSACTVVILLLQTVGGVARNSSASTLSRKSIPSRQLSVNGQGFAVRGICFVATNKMAFNSRGEKYGPPVAMSRMNAVR